LPGGNGRDSGIAGRENMGIGFKFQMGMGMDENGNEVVEMGGNRYEKSVPAHLYMEVPVIAKLVTDKRDHTFVQGDAENNEPKIVLNISQCTSDAGFLRCGANLYVTLQS